MTRQLYLDAAVAAYASGHASPLRDCSRRLLENAASGELILHTSTETMQEFCFHRMRMTARESAVAETERLMAVTVVHDFDHEVLAESLRLINTSTVRGRDAVHAATALIHGLTDIASPDRAFDDVPGLQRVDPAEF